MTPQAAEALALQALAWVMGDDDLRGAFMGQSGLSGDDVRAGVSDPGFLAGLLDFVMSDDRSVMAFCDMVGVGYDQPMLARQSLPGQGDVHWT